MTNFEFTVSCYNAGYLIGFLVLRLNKTLSIPNFCKKKYYAHFCLSWCMYYLKRLKKGWFTLLRKTISIALGTNDHKQVFWWNPSIKDGVHRTENFVEIIPVFSIFSNFFKKKNIYIYIKAILCNFSVRLLKNF